MIELLTLFGEAEVAEIPDSYSPISVILARIWCSERHQICHGGLGCPSW